MKNDEVDFIARRYREGRFSPADGWKRLGVVHVSRQKRYRVAAAVAATVLISASAAIIYKEYRAADTPQPAIEVSVSGTLTEVKVIDFENASLNDVVDKIETVYNVKVENLPSDGKEYELSLHYEGTPAELIDAINDILGTQMTVSEK